MNNSSLLTTKMVVGANVKFPIVKLQLIVTFKFAFLLYLACGMTLILILNHFSLSMKNYLIVIPASES